MELNDWSVTDGGGELNPKLKKLEKKRKPRERKDLSPRWEANLWWQLGGCEVEGPLLWRAQSRSARSLPLVTGHCWTHQAGLQLMPMTKSPRFPKQPSKYSGWVGVGRRVICLERASKSFSSEGTGRGGMAGDCSHFTRSALENDPHTFFQSPVTQGQGHLAYYAVKLFFIKTF